MIADQDPHVMPWETFIWNPRATPPLSCGQSHPFPIKDLLNEPVVPKANERHFNSKLFNIRPRRRNHVFISSNSRDNNDGEVCRLLLPSEAADIGSRRCRSPPTMNQIEMNSGHQYRLRNPPAFTMRIFCRRDTRYVAWQLSLCMPPTSLWNKFSEFILRAFSAPCALKLMFLLRQFP